MKLIRISLILIVLMLIFLAVTHKTVFRTETDPTGSYTAVVSFRTYLSFLPMSIGGSSDKPGFVAIYDSQHVSMGEVPVPMLQLAEIEWSETGASIKLVAEWDFVNQTCFYWSEDETHRIYVRGDSNSKE